MKRRLLYILPILLVCAVAVGAYYRSASRNYASLSDAERRTKVMTLSEVYKAKFPNVDEVTPEEAMRIMADGDAVFVDARDPKERQVSIVPGALAWEDYMGGPARFVGKAVILYCTIGYRSGVMAETLRKEGRAVAFNLQGGVLGWLHAGGPLVDPDGKPTRRVHVYGAAWDLAPRDMESVY